MSGGDTKPMQIDVVAVSTDPDPALWSFFDLYPVSICHERRIDFVSDLRRPKKVDKGLANVLDLWLPQRMLYRCFETFNTFGFCFQLRMESSLSSTVWSHVQNLR